MSATAPLRAFWSAVSGATGGPPALEVTDSGPWLRSPLPVDDLAVAACGTALLAAVGLAAARTGRAPAARLAGEHVALSFGSERHARRDGQPVGASFAPLSRFVRCAGGGWARTHGNYPHHARALLRALRIDAEPQADQAPGLERAAQSLPAAALEEAVIDAGGCAAAVRTPEEWLAHPVGGAARGRPVVEYDHTVSAHGGRPLPPHDTGGPASGFRVLDLTRVIAGPIAGRTLAALGADVLRIDPPGLPELAAQHLDTGAGKRTAFLDLANGDVREALLAGADVILLGYRSGSLHRFGLAPEALAERHPHLVTVSLSAWGPVGPWAQRRGFDSLVQAASGVARLTASDEQPGALPVQALDHASGHLMAAAALTGLAERARHSVHHPARVSLTRTAAALLAMPSRGTIAPERAPDPERHLVRFGALELIAPPGSLDGAPLRWAHGPRTLGVDPPRW